GHGLILDLPGIECLLDQRNQVVLARLFLLDGRFVLAAVGPELERDREPTSGHFVERVREEGRVLRLLGELAMEGGSAGELERQGVPGEPGRVSLAQDGRGRDRLLLNGREHGPLPGLLELLELNGRRVRNAYLLRAGVDLGARTSQSAPSGMAFSGMPPLLQPFEAIRRPLAGKIR